MKVIPWKLGLALLVSCWATNASARILAVCGSSQGMAFYLKPEVTGWQDDAVTKGSMTFLLKDDGEPDILIKDAFEKTFSATDDGSLVLAPFVATEDGTFTFVLVSAKARSVATYQLSIAPNGKRMMLWTDSKNLAAGIITKVSAYVSDCESGNK